MVLLLYFIQYDIANKRNNNLLKGKVKNMASESYKYNSLMQSYLRALGSPPRFTAAVDPYYNDNIGAGTGRAMASTWFSNPAIFSICPGTVDYLPGFSSNERETFFNRLKDSFSSEDSLSKALLGRINEADKLSGKLYAFKSAYKDYINVVNLMARTAAIYLGIGDVTNAIPGSSVPLKKFDYGYYTTPSKSIAHNSIFAETLRALSNVVSDATYIHFFLNNQGSAVQENISTTSTTSILEQKLSEGDMLSSIGRNIEFLFGGAIGSTAKTDIEEAIKEATNGSSFLSSFARSMADYVTKGGRLVFPQMIDSVQYDKTVSVSMKFVSPYGDKRSIFLRTILPAIHLLAIASPKQLSDNMYTYPFLCRVYQRGWFNSDLAFINSLEFTRGGSDNTCWTADGLPTEIEATFNVTPLYSSLMVTSAANPLLFLQNTSLMEYLGTMCGLDLKMNNLSTKVSIAKQVIKNKVTSMPTNLARGIVDTKIMNGIRNFTQIIN